MGFTVIQCDNGSRFTAFVAGTDSIGAITSLPKSSGGDAPKSTRGNFVNCLTVKWVNWQKMRWFQSDNAA